MNLKDNREKQKQRIKKKMDKKKSGRNKSRDDRQKNTKKLRIVLILAAVPVVILGAAVAAFVIYENQKNKEAAATLQEQAQTVEKVPEEETVPEMGDNILQHIIDAGQAVADSFQKRPQSHELTDENAATFASVDSCVINGKTGKVDVTVSSDGIPKSDDKYYYLFAMDTYDTGLSTEDEYITREYKDEQVTMSANLNYKQAGSRLFQKFAVAVKVEDSYVLICTPSYITNPEAIAQYTFSSSPASKKGLLVDPNKLSGSELDDLGVKQAAYNIPVARLLGQTTSQYPTIYYQYGGNTYAFNGQVIAEYDIVFGTLTAKGITTTAILLNNYSSSYTELIHPLARSGGSAPYYAFNGAEKGGVDYMAAIGSFLAERYSNGTHGKVTNWVIANEINARKEWNYMQHVDTTTYVEEYAKAFRVFYTAIKSVNANAGVYISIDQQWDRNISNNTNYDGRDILDEFNRNITSKGNIDWGVAQHPYNVPLTSAKAWASSKYVTHSSSTSMITMDNIEVLTDYMCQGQFLNPDGQVRSIILSEQGYTSSTGEALQAAAFAFAYYTAENNQYIDAFLLNRQTDASEEVAQGLAFGLNGLDGHHKQLYDVFKYIDTSEASAHTDFALSIIGISSWSEVITRR